jgi:hypothetical protein
MKSWPIPYFHYHLTSLSHDAFYSSLTGSPLHCFFSGGIQDLSLEKKKKE